MKVRVKCKLSGTHIVDTVNDHNKDTFENTRENTTEEISICHLKTSPKKFTDNSFKTTQEYPLEVALTDSTENTSEVIEEKSSSREGSKSSARSAWWEIGRLFIKITVIAACFILIFTFLYGFHRNSDPDMAPMIKNGDLLLFYRLDKDYAIDDLLLLDFQGERQVRRVVARAGDTVDISEAGLIINGGHKNEPEIYEETLPYENGISFPLTVGEGQVFTLGDARENATDSRVYGPVDTDDTLGTVITVMRRRGL